MGFNDFFDKANISEEGKAAFLAIHKMSVDEKFAKLYLESLMEFKKGDAAFGEHLPKFAEEVGLSQEELNFYLYVRISKLALEEYRERGIDEKIFYDSISTDFVPSCKAYCKKYGVYGIAKTARRWIGLVFAGKIFNLGSLRFQIAPSRYDAEIDGVSIKKGEPCISVHISREKGLDEERCEASYAEAREFFAKHFGMKPPVFFCYSWLMQPWLVDVVGEDSNIAKFQKKYRNIDFVEDPGDVLMWVFPEKCERIEDYPEDTKIQRATKERMLRGEIIGYGSGVRL